MFIPCVTLCTQYQTPAIITTTTTIIIIIVYVFIIIIIIIVIYYEESKSLMPVKCTTEPGPFLSCEGSAGQPVPDQCNWLAGSSLA